MTKVERRMMKRLIEALPADHDLIDEARAVLKAARKNGMSVIDLARRAGRTRSEAKAAAARANGAKGGRPRKDDQS